MTTSSDLQAALALHQQGRLQDALTRYNRILAEAPDHLEALRASGAASSQLGMHDTAADRFERALRIEPSNARGWAQLATTYEAQARYDDAVAALERALVYAPD